MMGVHRDKTRYDALVHDEGILRTLFKAIKSSTSASSFDRVFITGVSPVVLSDITSGYNIAENIYFHHRLNDLCGFRQEEVRGVIEKIVDACNQDTQADQGAQGQGTSTGTGTGIDKGTKTSTSTTKIEEALELMKTYYNGYRFAFGPGDYIYNPTLCLYFFGVLTLAGENDEGEILMKVPNLVMQALYVERVQRILLPEPADRDDGYFAAKQLYQKGNIEPLCEFVEKRFFTVFRNRDYRWANELTLKTAFLTLLYNDIMFIMDSEPEIHRRFADLTMIIRPDKRHFKISDVLIEFKFLSLKSLNLTGDGVRQLSEKEIFDMPQVKEALKEGQEQVVAYGESLQEKYGNLRLQKFVVASLGFERVCFRKTS